MNKLIVFKNVPTIISIKINSEKMSISLNIEKYDNCVLCFECIESDLISIFYFTVLISNNSIVIFNRSFLDHDDYTNMRLDFFDQDDELNYLYNYSIKENEIDITSAFFKGDITNIKYTNVYVLKRNKDVFYEIDNYIESNAAFCSIQDYFFDH